MRAFVFIVLILVTPTVAGQVSTAFTYQGELSESSQPADGTYDFEFALYDVDVDGVPFAGPVTIDDVTVSDGLFTVEIDFGPLVFGLTDQWLEIRLRDGGSTGGYTVLSPRQKITPTPMALNAQSVEFGVVGSAQVADGSVRLRDVDASQIQARVRSSCAPGSSIRSIDSGGGITCEVDDDAGGDITGVVAGSGLSGGATSGSATLSLDPTAVWSTSGNAALGGDFIGTTNEEPLVLRVNDRAVARIFDGEESDGSHNPTWVAGSEDNVVDRGSSPLLGAAILGGGGDAAAAGCGANFDQPCINTVGADYATVVGGLGNYATGQSSTVMGLASSATGTQSTAIGFGARATNLSATAIGNGTLASGSSAMALGFGSRASGSTSLAIGINAQASGTSSTAMGERSVAQHEGAFVYGDGSGNVADIFESTADHQFLIQAIGGMGVGTNAPVTQFDVKRDVTGTAAAQNHVAYFENTATGANGDVLALKVNTADPDSSSNYLTFIDGDDEFVGAIDGNSIGGVNYKTGGGDFAEMLPRRDRDETIEAGDIVGVFEGEVARETSGAQRLMVVSDRAAVTGNVPGDEADQALHETVAFVGRVPVRVRGPVAAGDLIVASGDGDGIGRAIDPAVWQPKRDGPLVGQAWAASPEERVKRVMTVVGLDATGSLVRRMARQRQEITVLREQVAELMKLRGEFAALRSMIAEAEGSIRLRPGSRMALADESSRRAIGRLGGTSRP